MRIATAASFTRRRHLSTAVRRSPIFERGLGLFRGDEIIARFTGAICVRGALSPPRRSREFDLLPLLWTFAYPSGLIERSAYETLKSEFFERLRKGEAEQGPVDGMLLDLHGAMVVDGIDDADGDMIAAARAALGRRGR